MKHVNSVLTRRSFIASGVAVASTLQLQRAARALGFAPEADVCGLAAEQEEGPYYVVDEMVRSNIVEGKPGVPLSLRLVLLDARTCKPLQNAAVDIWHCDAGGVYSGYTKQSMMQGGPPGGPNGPGGPDGPNGQGGPPPGFDPQHPGDRPGPPGGMGGPPKNNPTDKFTFLRGIQITGADGSVNFQTVFPGFYQGRTNHIHFKVREGGSLSSKTYAAGHTSHTGQIFFPEEVNLQLMQHEPYNLHKIHRTTQAEDHVFGEQNGLLFIARLLPMHSGNFGAGIHAELIAAVDPTATPGPVQFMGGPGGPR
jgi:protocatechuate 3,4-dioxygenase beta subunit